MRRTVNDIRNEYRLFAQRLHVCRETLKAKSGFLSELQLAGYKTTIADCEERIAELIREAGTMVVENQS